MKNFQWHLLALITACIWGSTFAASSVLISAGLTPAEIMSLRFVIAYILLLPFCRKSIITPLRHEWYFILLGITGGSLYFLSENYAIKLTNYTSTVALIVCTCPILTAIINRIIWRSEKLSNRFLLGSILALAGVSLVVLNGVFVLDDNPWVILLSFAAALLWSVYSLILKVQERTYSSDVITRKVFFWGTVTMLPVCIAESINGSSDLLNVIKQPSVCMALLYLAIIASLGCFLVWNIVCRRLTVVTASNYLYFNPVTSLFAGAIILGETITIPAIVGCAITIAGVWLCNKR